MILKNLQSLYKKIFLFLIIFSVNTIYGQGYYNQWFFGEGAGLDFNSCHPTTFAGNVHSIEGCASICDYYGNLLFYTDGVSVWNDNHVLMPNGSGLLGHQNAAQSSLIVPNPGDSNQYYIFTTPWYNDTGALRYSIVDITLDGGHGDVTATKNFMLHPVSEERVTAVRAINGTDFWILGHEPSNNVFFAYLLTATGLNPVPVLSTVGVTHPDIFANQGYLKPNHHGDKLAMSVWFPHHLEIFDFDKTSGVISHPVTFPTSLIAYGLEFSPDDNLLYFSGLTACDLYQVNMNAGNDSLMIASTTLIASPPGPTCALLLGPDGKIYAAKYGEAYLGVINNPNAQGLACNYVDNQILLSTGISQSGLPNFFEMNVCTPPNINLGNDTILCMGQTLTLSVGPANSYLWSDSTTGPSIMITAPGTYWVEACSAPCLVRDSITVDFEPAAVTLLTNDTAICAGQSIMLIAAGMSAYTWAPQASLNLSSGDSVIAEPTSTTTYTVTGSSSGCYDTGTVTIMVHPLPVIAIDTVMPGCPGMDNGSLTVTVISGTSPYVYWWNTGDSIPGLNNLTNGTYTVTVSDAHQCSVFHTIDLNIITDCIDPVVYVPNIFSPNGDGINDVIYVHGRDIQIDWIIFDRWGEEVFESEDISSGWDGTFKGKKMPSDVYVYRLIVTWADGTETRKKGNISLVR